MTFTQQERAVGHGRAANATGVGSSVRRTHLQLALVGRAAERAARHHIRRIVGTDHRSDCCETTWPKKRHGQTKAPRASQARPRSARASRVGIARIERSGVSCLQVWCHRRSSGPPGTQTGHAPAQNACGGAWQGATWRFLRDVVGVPWFMRTPMSYCNLGRPSASKTCRNAQHPSRTVESVRRR